MQGSVLNFENHRFVLWIIKYLCLYRLQQEYKPKSTIKYISVFHANKLVEAVEFNKIMKSDTLCQLFPNNSEVLAKPVITYTHAPTIRSKLMNYNQTFKHPNPDEYICRCKTMRVSMLTVSINTL